MKAERRGNTIKGKQNRTWQERHQNVTNTTLYTEVREKKNKLAFMLLSSELQSKATEATYNGQL